MNVESWMVTDIVTIGKEAGIRDALTVMKKYSVRHLPVVESGLFIGLVTSGDLKQAILASMLETLKVSDVMLQNPYTITRDTPLEKAAGIIYEKNIGCLPVVEEGKIVGIITIKDILKAFIEIMGVLKSGSRIDVILKNVHGSFDEVVSVIERNGGYIISAGMTISGDEDAHHFRISGGDTAAIAEELIQLGYRGVKVVD
ncbi:MAG: Inosine-5'-monophosphate dehydrogenase [Deltaproteobacteria bacterium ADurb.BinA179]|jgi:acetoin utilization protein AcuB|nr:MAG: Inosine-5'-monophosphate dehydrogenase [Deltaproteobacteria bacterium ADurb.BinA179]HOD70331.1 CBS domain-containing protein [Deltaproteobacteria bacterium]HRR22332.1 CBS domain-containing protein [Desulfomonilia bacterium]HOS27923.1 CBS domain-containing protein [Deltaproteobacteria bacterium]HPX51279.1 CBS domain-containing protein [Deltaproteobacteria bacterium]